MNLDSYVCLNGRKTLSCRRCGKIIPPSEISSTELSVIPGEVNVRYWRAFEVTDRSVANLLAEILNENICGFFLHLCRCCGCTATAVAIDARKQIRRRPS